MLFSYNNNIQLCGFKQQLFSDESLKSRFYRPLSVSIGIAIVVKKLIDVLIFDAIALPQVFKRPIKIGGA